MSNIKPHMEIISLCGCLVGIVDHVKDGAIKLARNDSPDGKQFFIPIEWVERIDECVHLNKDVFETKDGWKSDVLQMLSSI